MHLRELVRHAAGSRAQATILIAIALLAGDVALRSVHAQQDAVPKVVTAQEFRLVDKAGKTRAAFAVRDDGSPAMNMLDANGHVRATVRLNSDGSAAVSLHDAEGALRAGIDCQADGSASLSLRQAKGGVALVVKPNGDPIGIFKDHSGAPTWIAPEPAVPAVEK